MAGRSPAVTARGSARRTGAGRVADSHPARHPRPLPPTAVVLSFIDCINRLDLDGLLDLMTEDHELHILDEEPVVGRDSNRRAWRGYFEAFPHYVVYPHRIADRGNAVAVLGTTTGSHLMLPDEKERQLLVLWVGEVRDGRLASWSIVDDTPEGRARHGLG